MNRTIHIISPGDINQLTGGYGYLRRLVAGLTGGGIRVVVHELPGPHPFVDTASRDAADIMMAAIPDRAIVLIDGLALPVAAHAIWVDRYRLRFAALIHHPLHLENGLDDAQAELLRRIERDALAHVRHVIVPSIATRTGVIDLMVPAARITVANPGTDHADPSMGSVDGVPNLLCVATLTPRKGHLTLIQALAGLTHLPWRLVLVGSDARHPGHAAALADAVVAAGLTDRVRMTGELSGPALEAEWRAADLFVLASHHEGYGMVAAEALMRGLPCIVTDAGGLAEVVPPAAGSIVPPGDVAALTAALGVMISDPDVRAAAARVALDSAKGLPRWFDTIALIRDALTGILPEAEQSEPAR